MFERKRSIGTWVGRRFWEYRQFYSAYVALFISISTWITVQYRLVFEDAPILNNIFSDLWVFLLVAVVIFSVGSILGGHFIHRKKQFRIEQELAVEENPYVYRAIPGKERDLMIPIFILQLETLEDLLRQNQILTEDKKRQFQTFKQELMKLADGHAIGRI